MSSLLRSTIVLIIVMSITQLPSLNEALLWDRDLIPNGEYWRLFTGNLTHSNWAHMIMNVSAFAIIVFIFRQHFNIKKLIAVISVSASVIGLVMFLSPFQTYVGLSGVLHALFAWGAVQDTLNQQKGGWLLIIGLIAKVGWEQWVGPSESTAALIDAAVATQAHLAGAITGAAMSLIYGLKQKL